MWNNLTMLQLLYVISLVVIVSSSVTQQRALVVERGRSAFLHPNDLTFDLEEGELCQVEVVSNEPDTQRVGKLKPTVFDCLFLPYTVQYTHMGSPLVNSDSLKLTIFRNKNGEDVRVERIELAVDIIESPYEVIIHDPTLRSLEVKEFKGRTDVIDSRVLRFRYNYYNGASCRVSFNHDETHWPIVGHLIELGSSEPLKDFNKDCREFLFMGVQYQHLHAPTPDTDYIPLRVEVEDQSMGSEPVIEYYYLPVKIDGAFPNNPPKLTLLGSNIFEVVESTLTILDSELLLAEDVETSPENIVFKVIQPDHLENGYFVHVEHFTVPLWSFTQQDLLEDNIGFMSPPADTSQESGQVIKAEFITIDQNFDTSSSVSLHIAVLKTSSSTGPRLIESNGLILREGTSAPITTDLLKIYDPDNSYNVEVHVRGGLRSGHLEVNGRESEVFSIDDMKRKAVIYYHDGRDAIEDKLILRITDGERNIRGKFPIKILQEDDASPSLIQNEGLEVHRGGETQITPLVLSAKDRDSPQEDILYILKTSPSQGHIIRKIKPMTEGKTIVQFTQVDVEQGTLYYRHSGSDVLADTFEIRLLDKHDPPNKSGRFLIEVIIHPEPHMPPHHVPTTTLELTVKETQIAFITKDMLCYENFKDEHDDIRYTITSLPFFLTTTITIDGGRLFNAVNITRLTKDASYPPLLSFTQNDVNMKKVAYMPPMEDVGPVTRSAKFVFAVSDSRGNRIFDQVFSITILPENNQVPHMTLHPLQVWEGGTGTVTTRDIMAYDPDTDQSELIFIIEDQPKYGLLLKGETRITRGQQFTPDDLSNGVISYIHDGSEVEEDSFGISVSDGMNKFTKVMKVAIEMVSNQEPRPLPNLNNSITVTEGGEVILSKAHIGATDNDTEDMSLMFMLVKPPRIGLIKVNGRPAKEFSQRDLTNRVVKYVHTEGEIGMSSKMDTITFLIMDESLATKKGNRIPLLDLNITIVPVDNAQPELILGEPLLVNEGQRALISFEILTAHDLDTPPEAIGFIVEHPPKFGFIENAKRPSGPEKRNAGKTVSSFMLADLKDGSINYVSDSDNVLPEEDSFAVYVTDGKQSSPAAKVNVIIVPDQNNHLLLFDVDQLIVEEGSHRVFDVHLSENPNPMKHWMLSLEKAPMHGELLLAMDSPDLGGMVELPLQEVSMLDMGRNLHLLYRHDGSETTKDIFTLKVSDGEFAATKISPVVILPVNDEIPQLMVIQSLIVNVSTNAIITDDFLIAVDEDNQNDEIYFILTSLPKYGNLEQMRYDGYNVVPQNSHLLPGQWHQMALGENFTQLDIHERGLRYVHQDENSWAMEDEFKFHLTDGLNSIEEKTFKIIIQGSRPHELTLLNLGMTIHAGDTQTITEDMLSASDAQHSRPEEIMFTITKEPQYGSIMSYSTQFPTRRFTQLDLMTGDVAFTHTSSGRYPSDTAGLSITSKFNYTVNTVFKIHIEFLDKNPPILDTNMALTVEQGDSSVISSTNLHMTDPDTETQNLTFILLEGPHNGKVYNRLGATTVFTQYEVDQNEIFYRSESRGDTGIDYFLFTITDDYHQDFLTNGTQDTQPSFFNILIQPMVKKPPQMVVNQSPNELEFLSKDKYGFILTAENLKAEHPISDPVDIIYSIDEKPMFGSLEHLGTRRPIKKRFSQKDLDDARIAFVLDHHTDVTNDSFTFRVYDRNRNTLDNQRFILKWAIIEMAQTQYFVCEDAEVLHVMIMRRGDASIHSSIGIKTKGMSAKEGLDYEALSADLVEFKPGDNNATWEVVIRMDRDREENEKFKVLLRRPTNALIGEYDKTTVQIINYDHGRCEEYIGMVTKNNNSPLGPDFYTPENSQFGGLFDQMESQDTDEYDLPSYYDTDTSFNPYDDEQQDEDNLDFTDSWGDLGTNEDRNNRKDRRNKHPMAKYKPENPRDEGRRNGRKKNKKKKNKGTFEELGLDGFDETSSEVQNAQMLPQSCTPDTRGLLYFDLMSSKMYRCNGFMWEHLGWGTGSYQYASMLQDAASPTDSNDDDEKKSSLEGAETFVGIGENGEKKWQCPKGWSQYKENCYKFVSHKVTWSEAEQQCNDQDAHLTEVSSSKHQDFLWDLSKKRSFWIGMNDQRVGGAWENTNESPVRFFNWRHGFPRTPRFYEAKCVLVSKRAQWVNRECETRKSRYVCSRPLKPRRKRHQHKHRLSWYYEGD